MKYLFLVGKAKEGEGMERDGKDERGLLSKKGEGGKKKKLKEKGRIWTKSH